MTPRPAAGMVYGRLTVLVVFETRPNRSADCICICGTVKRINLCALRAGLTKSCGCLNRDSTRERSTRHGRAATPEYHAWQTMRQRCNNPKNKRYPDYGGRGIRVCPEWEEFEQFFRDMGERPSAQHSLDRRDNDGNYEAANCRWATYSEQSSNCRKRRGTTSIYPGVFWDKTHARWRVEVRIDGKSWSAGYFRDEQSASQARPGLLKRAHFKRSVKAAWLAAEMAF